MSNVDNAYTAAVANARKIVLLALNGEPADIPRAGLEGAEEETAHLGEFLHTLRTGGGGAARPLVLRMLAEAGIVIGEAPPAVPRESAMAID